MVREAMKMRWRRGVKGGANRRGKQMKQNRRRLDLENIEG